MDKLNRADLAALLEISPARVQQLTGLGVFDRHADGYDPLECAVALCGYVRRDEAQKAARTRLVLAAAAISERKQRQALRQLVTLDEVRCTLDAAFEAGWIALQGASANAFAQLAAELGDQDKARVSTYGIYDWTAGAMRQFQSAANRAIKELAAGLHDGQRLDDVVEELRQAVDGAADDGDEAA